MATLASLVVKLSLQSASFQRDLETVSRKIERAGKQIRRAGREMTEAISLPLLLAGMAAFKVALDDSHRSFGPLFEAFEGLKAAVHDLFLALGRELTPVFLAIIQQFRVLIQYLADGLKWFDSLSP